MDKFFLSLINVSITASWLVLAVLLIRLVFRKAPRWMYCLLWGMVGLRLLLPFSIESIFSLIPSTQTLPQEMLLQSEPKVDTGIAFFNNSINPVISDSFSPEVGASVNPVQVLSFVSGWIWAVGLSVMLLYALISTFTLRRRVRTATLLRDNIRCSEFAASPFVLGIIRPKIYLPYNLAEEDINYVIRHEQAHIARGDHLIKPLGFVLLSVHWFNPLMWIAYIMLCRDIELACDERVIAELGESERREYTSALLDCSAPRRAVSACPLAFGEVGIKERIKRVMSYKKAAVWVAAAAVAVCAVTAVFFLTDPAGVPISNIESRSAMEYSSLLEEVTMIELEHYGNICGLDKAQFEETLEFLDSIRITRREISMNRSEDRDKSHTIYVYSGEWVEKIHISADYSALWIDNSVKPTLSYRVLHPKELENFFLRYFADDILDAHHAVNALEPIESAVHYIPVGYSHNAAIAVADNADNSDLIDADIAVHMPVWAIDSLDEYDAFYAKYSHYHDFFVSPVAGSPSFESISGRYDADFFKDNILLVVCAIEPSGSIRHNACAVRQGSSLVALVESVQPDGAITNDMAVWFIALEISREKVSGCTQFDAQPGTSIVASRKYVYTNSALQFSDKAGFILRSDGTFEFYWSMLSSYIGWGSYQLEDGVLTLATADGLYSYTFIEQDDGFIFDAARSSPMPEYRYSPDSPAQPPVPDGALFKPDEIFTD